MVSGELGPAVANKHLRNRLRSKGAEHAHEWVAEGAAAPAVDAGAVVYDEDEYAEEIAAAEAEAEAAEQQKRAAAAAAKAPAAASKKARRK